MLRLPAHAALPSSTRSIGYPRVVRGITTASASVLQILLCLEPIVPTLGWVLSLLCPFATNRFVQNSIIPALVQDDPESHRQAV
jgi:hypothetical protein